MKYNYCMTYLRLILFLQVSAGWIKNLNGLHMAVGQLVMTRQSELHQSSCGFSRSHGCSSAGFEMKLLSYNIDPLW